MISSMTFPRKIFVSSAVLMPALCLVVAFVVFAHDDPLPEWNPNNAWCQSFAETTSMPSYCFPACNYPRYTSESAGFESRNATSIYWNRDQTRYFDPLLCGPAPGFNYCYNTLRHKVLNTNFPSGCWDGYETKYKVSGNPDKVYADSYVKTYQGEQINGVWYRCPTIYQHIQGHKICPNGEEDDDWNASDISEYLGIRDGFPVTDRYTLSCINGTKPGLAPPTLPFLSWSIHQRESPEFMIKIKLGPTQTEGSLSSILTIFLPEGRTMTLPVVAQVDGPIRVRPETIFYGTLVKGQHPVTELTLESATPFQIVRVKTPESLAVVEPPGKENRMSFRMKVCLAATVNQLWGAFFGWNIVPHILRLASPNRDTTKVETSVPVAARQP